MKNQISRGFRDYSDVWKSRSNEFFHQSLLCHALDEYRKDLTAPLGKALVICGNQVEVRALAEYAFSEILITNIEPANKPPEIPRTRFGATVQFGIADAEKLPFEDRSFDLVLCKEGIHHLSRPVQGFYEMLRVAKNGVILIEPSETWAGKLAEWAGVASVYERKEVTGAPRDNFVFRWNRSLLTSLLNSYYLESGYRLKVYQGWFSSRFTLHRSRAVRLLSWIGAKFMRRLPGCRGNYLTAVIYPGSSLPQSL